MKRWLLALAWFAACKERGTITIDLADAACGAARVRFQAIRNGTCSCTCGQCECTTQAPAECILDVPCASGCAIADVRADGIEFDPPSAGQYALTYEFLDDSVPAKTRSVVCVLVEVDADGTASSTTTPTTPACCTSAF